MLSWQKAHIQRNYPELIKSTTCTVGLLTRLQRDNILTADEVQSLRCEAKTSLEKTKLLYEILETRTSGYEQLISILDAERQTGALDILKNSRSEFVNFKLISVDTSQILGKGRPGTKVFRGKFDGRDVAVKLISEDVQQAVEEVDLLKKLDHHPHIVRYFFAEQVKNKVYIALELCYVNLEDQIRIKILSVDNVKILNQGTMGVAFLHKQGIIHRDLKPANILLTNCGVVKISDFGFSKSIPASTASASGIYGTEDWMSPEVLEMRFGIKPLKISKISTKADIFALGCIYFFVLTNGGHPFGLPGHRTYKILKNIPHVQESTLEVHWKRVISEMVSMSPVQRPDTEKLMYIFEGNWFHVAGAKKPGQTSSFKDVLKAKQQKLAKEFLGSCLQDYQKGHECRKNLEESLKVKNIIEAKHLGYRKAAESRGLSTDHLREQRLNIWKEKLRMKTLKVDPQSEVNHEISEDCLRKFGEPSKVVRHEIKEHLTLHEKYPPGETNHDVIEDCLNRFEIFSKVLQLETEKPLSKSEKDSLGAKKLEQEAQHLNNKENKGLENIKEDHLRPIKYEIRELPSTNSEDRLTIRQEERLKQCSII